MIASVHIADVGFPRAARRLLRAPSSPGLRRADVAVTAPLGGPIWPSPQAGRLALVALWDDDASLDRFLADHPIWATGMARPPFVGTCSLWASTEALSDYAYGPTDPAHPDAIAADRARPFHHREAFIRFRPYASHGSLRGRNPLAENWMDPAAQRG